MPCEHCRCFLTGLPVAEGILTPELYHPRITLFEQGTPAHAGFIICAGAVQLEQRTQAGSRWILKFVGPGCSLLYELLAGATHYQVTAQTVCNSRILRVSPSSFLHLLDQFSDLRWRISVDLAREVLFWQHRLAITLDLDLGVRERLAIALLDLSAAFGVDTANSRLIDLELNNQQWADYVGCRRQTITNAFSDLEKRGWVERRGRKVLLKDLGALKQFVKSYV